MDTAFLCHHCDHINFFVFLLLQLNCYLFSDYDSKKLEVLYEARVREVHRLNEQLEQLREKAAYEKDQLFRKFALSEAEKERVQLLYKQCHEQLGMYYNERGCCKIYVCR